LRRGGGGSAAIEAAASLERAAALDPTALAPRAVLAEACAVAYDATRDAAWLARGRDALAQAERVNPDAIAVHLAGGRLNEVAAAYDRAAQAYTRATELDSNNADAWRGLARTYQGMQGHDSDAARAFQTAIDVQPKYFAPLNDYADFQRLRGNYTQAEALWRRAADLAPDSLAAHANLGGLYSDMGRYADAERELQRALAIDARVRPVLNNLGSLYQYMGRDVEAAVQFERARTIGPESPALLLNLGDSYRRLGRHADAAAAYRQARVLADEQLLKNPRDAAIRSFVAYFALRLGDRAAAERELTQALSLEPQNRTVIRRAAICYETWGQRDRTLAVLQSASPDVLKELSRQPDLTALRGDPRFKALLPSSR
jgi:tetratricopeptide (TPR) repeat protein